MSDFIFKAQVGIGISKLGYSWDGGNALRKQGQQFIYLDLIMLQMVPRQPIKVELPLPINFQQQLLNIKVVTILHCFTSVLTLLILLQELYSVDLFRPAFVFSATCVSLIVYAISLVGRRQLRKKDPAVLKKVLINPISIPLLALGACIFFKIPYYSIVFSIPSLVLTIILLKKLTNGLIFTQIVSSVAFIAINTFFGVYLLQEEGFLELEWKSNVLLAILSLVGFELEVVYDMVKERRNQNYNFSYSNYKIFLFNKITTTLFIFNCISYTTKPFIGAIYPCFLRFLFVFDCLATSFLAIFAEEVALFITCPQFTQWQALYRIHYCEFIEVYDKRAENRSQPWPTQTCKLCDKLATIINFPCGHLSLCRTCQQKFDRKGFHYCVICSERTTRTKELKTDTENMRYGYQRKVFIEKKLWKNQYLIH